MISDESQQGEDGPAPRGGAMGWWRDGSRGRDHYRARPVAEAEGPGGRAVARRAPGSASRPAVVRSSSGSAAKRRGLSPSSGVADRSRGAGSTQRLSSAQRTRARERWVASRTGLTIPASRARRRRRRPARRGVGVEVGRPAQRDVGVGRPAQRDVGVGRPAQRDVGVGRPAQRVPASGLVGRGVSASTAVSASRPIAAVSLRTSATASLDCSARLLSSRHTTRKARP